MAVFFTMVMISLLEKRKKKLSVWFHFSAQVINIGVDLLKYYPKSLQINSYFQMEVVNEKYKMQSNTVSTVSHNYILCSAYVAFFI